jgi:thioredoxin-related protein
MLQKLSRLIFTAVLLGGRAFAMPNFVDIAEEVWRHQVGVSFVDEQTAMLKLAQESHKYVFVACLGQSWCPWSKKFSEEVLQKREFLEGMEEIAVVGFVDVPESYEENVREKTAEVVRKYELKELPTFFLLDSS